MRKIAMTLGLLLGIAAGAQAAPVATAEGPVEGFSKNGVTQFLGLPFAKPPVGALRWMPPQAPAKWTAVRKADKFGPTCAQVTTLGPFAGPANSNEDCLYLNVFTPNDLSKEKSEVKLPVLVWIHGGGYYDGESNDYDATKLAIRGHMVVVTLNYRLNLFGFMAHPALDAEGHAFGNYGVMDMQAALRWVHANITPFGGDPGNVTLGGQSAGAGATAANVVSPGAAGLIHRAIYQSGGYQPFASRAFSEERGRKFAAAAGCRSKDEKGGDVAKCLRALPAAKVAALAGTASTTGPYINGPLVDGTVIPAQYIDLIRAGKFNKVPILFGTTRDEGNFFNGIIQYFKPGRAALTDSDFRAYLDKTYGGNAGPGGGPPAYAKGTVDKVLMHYPTTGGAQMAWDAAHSDMLACRGQSTAEALSAHVPVYMYLFSDRSAPSYFPKMPGYQALAYHTGDIPYVFTGYHGGPDGLPTPLSPAQAKLSDHLIDAWANFARTGNPNGAGDAPWPRWKKGADTSAYLLQGNLWGKTQTNAEFAAAHQCPFWQSILLYK
jgi:para-nitrobenzyl esterase